MICRDGYAVFSNYLFITAMKDPCYLGIDVGTGSARAGIFSSSGKMLGSASKAFPMWKPEPDFVEQSSEAIWQACATAVKAALKLASVGPEAICGIGFDATCSLVVIDAEDKPVTVSPTEKDEQNVIVWMDHRAHAQTAHINELRHPVLRYVGGQLSPEMQTPKLLWLKQNMKSTWKRAARFFDLPDYLTYRATGDDTRSLCSVVCKWTYLGHRGLDGAGWDAGYFKKIGLADLTENHFHKIGSRVRPMGETLGNGLTAKAAKELGLRAGTPVGVSIIDAHAGGLGLLGAQIDGKKVTPAALNKRLALIGGTSTCHMAVSGEPRFIKGVWGPYFSAMVPGFWLTEGGQSATGALIDHVIHTHHCYPELQTIAQKAGQSVYEVLNAHLATMTKREGLTHYRELTADLHVQPDFHGNRSPRADATLKGGVSGLQLSATMDDLARLYLATVQAVAYGTRHILEELNKGGYRVETLLACGGGTKNPVFLREHADSTGCRISLPKEPEAVLLGAAVCGAVTGKGYPDILSAMNAMNAADEQLLPEKKAATYHAAKYAVFHRMHKDLLAYRKLMGKK